MPHITANLPDQTAVKNARRIALEKNMSLREWAGNVVLKKIEAELARNRAALKRGDKLPKRNSP